MRTHNGRTDLRIAAIRRKADAEHLLRNGNEQSIERYARGAAYLAGYAVECKLKAVAMEVYDCWTLDELTKKLNTADRDVYTHGLEPFARRLPIWNRLRGNRGVWRDFCLVNKWRPHWRYDPRVLAFPEARRFLAAVDRRKMWVRTAIREFFNGLLRVWRMGKKATQRDTGRPTKRLRSRARIKNALVDAFRKEFPQDTIDVSDGYQDNIHLLIVSRRFDEMDEAQKQDMLWSIIDRSSLTEQEKQLISLVLPLSPAQIK